jgi:hypothetical protein
MTLSGVDLLWMADITYVWLQEIPFRRNKFISGWRLAGLVTGSTGLPVNVADGFDQTLGDAAVERPIQHFNPACYTLQVLGTEGNVRRNSIYGPSFFNLDFSIMRRTKITENLDSEFRSEFFNLLNRANFGPRNQFVFTGPTAGQITSLATPPRQIQFAIKLLF